MPKTCTVFKDIGKACNDLLTKDFKVGKTTVELKSTTSSGVVRARRLVCCSGTRGQRAQDGRRV